MCGHSSIFWFASEHGATRTYYVGASMVYSGVKLFWTRVFSLNIWERETLVSLKQCGRCFSFLCHMCSLLWGSTIYSRFGKYLFENVLWNDCCFSRRSSFWFHAWSSLWCWAGNKSKSLWLSLKFFILLDNHLCMTLYNIDDIKIFF